MPPLTPDHKRGAPSEPEPLFTTSSTRYPPPPGPPPMRNPPPYNSNNSNGNNSNGRITFYENASSELPHKPTKIFYPFEQGSGEDFDDKMGRYVLSAILFCKIPLRKCGNFFPKKTIFEIYLVAKH